MSKLSFVIPCYGSETTIEIVVSEIIDTLQKRPEYDFEIILVNDCSPDLVWERIRSLALSNPHITGINLAKNFGQHAALMAGYRQCTGDLIISLDDDGQTLPASSLPWWTNSARDGMSYMLPIHIKCTADSAILVPG